MEHFIYTFHCSNSHFLKRNKYYNQVKPVSKWALFLISRRQKRSPSLGLAQNMFLHHQVCKVGEQKWRFGLIFNLSFEGRTLCGSRCEWFGQRVILCCLWWAWRILGFSRMVWSILWYVLSYTVRFDFLMYLRELKGHHQRLWVWTLLLQCAYMCSATIAL